MGELQSPVNVSVNGRGIYLADAGNDRIQSFDVARSSYFVPLWATPSSLGLDQPAAVAAATGLVEEKVWIADTGNNRVLLVKVPSSNPESAWNSMKQEIAGDDLEGALAYFSSTSVNKYREAFTVIGLDELKPVVNQIPSLTPVRIGRDIAEYRFQQTVEGFTVTFTVKFVMENGIWRIQEY